MNLWVFITAKFYIKLDGCCPSKACIVELINHVIALQKCMCKTVIKPEIDRGHRKVIRSTHLRQSPIAWQSGADSTDNSAVNQTYVMLTPHPLLVPWSRNSRAIPLSPPPHMGRTACTEPQCLYKGAPYLSFKPNVRLEANSIHFLRADRNSTSQERLPS